MLLNLFAPRPPLRWVEPADHAPEKRCTPKISGVGQYLQAMREYKDADNYVPTDSWLQKRDRKKQEKKEKQEKLLTDGVTDCTTSPQPITTPLIALSYANKLQINLAKTPKSKAMPSKLSSYLAWHTASPQTTSNANSAATVPLNASASSKMSPLRLMRRPRSANVVMPSSCTSARRI